MNYQSELNEYIETVAVRNASDLHLIVGNKPTFRVYRDLEVFIQKEELNKKDVEEFLKLLSSSVGIDATAKLKEDKHFLFRYTHTLQNGKVVNFRVAAYLERGRIAIALRFIPKLEKNLEDLNLPEILKNIARKPQGLFLITGPAGHGKSTTLAAIVEEINHTSKKHILTIEDPIEFLFDNSRSVITQRGVPDDVDSFRSALDSALRADADILMVGEMREVATMKTVMTAAEIGHLVLSTVHANSASQTVYRIIDSFPENQQDQIRYQFSYSLLGICSMRLVPRISGGLIPACEILLNNSAVSNLIRENRIASIDTVIQTSKDAGMISLDQSFAELVRKNEISIETAYEFSTDKKVLDKYL